MPSRSMSEETSVNAKAEAAGPPMHVAADRMTQQILGLREMVVALASRLNPVLCPTSDVEHPAAAVDTDVVRSMFTEWFRDRGQTVADISERVQDLLDRLEV
jgi:hypothetical protein